MNLVDWEIKFQKKIVEASVSGDPAHDLLHFKRVVTLAKKLCIQENGNLSVVVPAAWLHDLVNVRKDSPQRSVASRLSAEKAVEFLKSVNYPENYHADIANAIEGHSFSANLEVVTIDAKIVQDADRLDGLGAIGIARCFATAGLLQRTFYNFEDPFCSVRTPNDREFTIDHFFAKLFKTAETLKTKSGRVEGKKRIQVMKAFLSSLKSEI